MNNEMINQTLAFPESVPRRSICELASTNVVCSLKLRFKVETVIGNAIIWRSDDSLCTPFEDLEVE